MEYSFLLIGDIKESQWPLTLEQALISLGKMRLAPEADATQVAYQNYYDLIIIDAGITHDVIQLIASLRTKKPKTPIIVATASPTWQRAREALQAGAADYIRKSLDKGILRSRIEAVLSASSPSPPHDSGD